MKIFLQGLTQLFVWRRGAGGGGGGRGVLDLHQRAGGRGQGEGAPSLRPLLPPGVRRRLAPLPAQLPALPHPPPPRRRRRQAGRRCQRRRPAAGVTREPEDNVLARQVANSPKHDKQAPPVSHLLLP